MTVSHKALAVTHKGGVCAARPVGSAEASHNTLPTARAALRSRDGRRGVARRRGAAVAERAPADERYGAARAVPTLPTAPHAPGAALDWAGHRGRAMLEAAAGSSRPARPPVRTQPQSHTQPQLTTTLTLWNVRSSRRRRPRASRSSSASPRCSPRAPRSRGSRASPPATSRYGACVWTGTCRRLFLCWVRGGARLGGGLLRSCGGVRCFDHRQQLRAPVAHTNRAPPLAFSSPLLPSLRLLHAAHDDGAAARDARRTDRRACAASARAADACTCPFLRAHSLSESLALREGPPQTRALPPPQASRR